VKPLTVEVLNLLDAIAKDYGLRYEKHKKRLIEEGIRIIARLELEPVEDKEPKFIIPESLK
jgi:hypothetical protein